MQIGAVEPIFAEPVQVGKLLIRHLIQIAIGARGKLGSHEIIQIQARVGHIRARTRHEICQVNGQLQARVGSDQITVVDIGVIQVAPGLHLRLHGLYDFALAQYLVVDLDSGDLFKRFGQNFGFIRVGGYPLR